MSLSDQNPDESNLSPEKAPYLFIEYVQTEGLALQWWIFEKGWEPTGVVLSLVFTCNELKIALAEWSAKLEWNHLKTKKISLPPAGILWIFTDFAFKTLRIGTGQKINSKSQLGKVQMPMDWVSDTSTPFLTSVLVNPPTERGGASDPSLPGEIKNVVATQTPYWIPSKHRSNSTEMQRWWWIIPSLFLVVVIASFFLRKK